MKIEEEVNAQFKTPQQKAVLNIRFTSNYLTNFQNNFMSTFDLSMAQFNILRILRGAKDALNVNTVKDRMIEKSPNTTRLMDKLIEKGFIERTRCVSDRRVVYVQITQKGLTILKKIDEKFAGSSFMPTSLSDSEANTLSDLLDKVRAEFK